MKIQGIALIAALFVLATPVSRADDDAAAKKDLALLQGTWAMVSGARGGENLSDEMAKTARRVAKGNETSVEVGGQVVMKAKFTLNPATKPKSIDYEILEGLNKGKKMLGIYEINGEKIKFCFAIPDEKRPEDFVTKPGDGRTFSVWKKEKEAKKE